MKYMIGAIVNKIMAMNYIEALDCDGQSRLFSWALRSYKVEHVVHYGIVRVNGNVFPIHYWITFPGRPGWVLDMKLRKWFGSDVPHGFYEYATQSDVVYTSMGIDDLVIDDVIAGVLMLR